MLLPESAPLPRPSPPSSRAGALGATWQRTGRRAWRHLAVVGLLCLGIALLLTAIDGGSFGVKLVYSLCVGAVCTLTVDLTRLACALLTDRLRSARGLATATDSTTSPWLGVLPGALLCVAVGPLLGLGLGDWLTGYRSPSLLRWDSASTRVTLALSLLGTVASVFAISTLERLNAAREQAQQAERLAAENQLRLLQSQLEPHMLFNTLATLRVLIGLDAPQAQAMLDRLIAYLRATLAASRASAQPLAAEFAQLADYLALMALRMGPRLAVRLSLPPALADVPVPPLLLQPLVENAIKHGLEPQVAGGAVEVTARAAEGRLTLTVRDTGAGLQGGVDGGSCFGLEQVRTRLAALHGTAAALTLAPAADAAGGVLATIEMPLPKVLAKPVVAKAPLP